MESPSNVDMSILFDAMFAHIGGKIDPNSDEIINKNYFSRVMQTPEWLLDGAMQIHQRLDALDQKKWKVPTIGFGILDSISPNCYAKSRFGNYCIGMSAMIPYCALELVAYFFADPEFYPEFGDSAGQALVRLDGVNELPFFQIANNAYRPLFSEQLSEAEMFSVMKGVYLAKGQSCLWNPDTGLRFSATQYLSFNNVILDMILPRCPERRKYCLYFAYLLTTFFWLHEVAHCTEGHLNYVVEKKAGHTLMEFPERIVASNKIVDKDTIPSDLINLMEEEADQEALLVMIGLISDEDQLLNHDNLELKRTTAIEVFCFFVCALFSTYERYEKKHFLAPAESHPRGTARVASMLSTLIALLQTNKEFKSSITNCLNYSREISMYSRYRHLDCINKGMDRLLAQDFERRKLNFNVLDKMKGPETGILRLLCLDFFQNHLSAVQSAEYFRVPSFLNNFGSSS